ncbi:MAG: hypothetical protein JSS50_03670 [Proteobacteria bacterium]|nr:hypothetical protein [Pseudomonadota bacterium]
MKNIQAKRACVGIGISMLTSAFGMASYSLLGMLTNPAFIETNPGWREALDTINPITDAFQKANISPLAINIIVSTIATVLAVCCFVYAQHKEQKETDAHRTTINMVLGTMLGCLAASGWGTTIAYYNLPNMGDYTTLTEQVAVAAGVIAAVGIVLIVLGLARQDAAKGIEHH